MKTKKQKSQCTTPYLTLAILCAIGIGGFYLSKTFRLDSYYQEQLRVACSGEIDPKTQKWGEHELDKLEAHMLRDGYNMAQISSMRNKAYDKAYEKKKMIEKYSK